VIEDASSGEQAGEMAALGVARLSDQTLLKRLVPTLW
jgi:hypothetical protein